MKATQFDNGNPAGQVVIHDLVVETSAGRSEFENLEDLAKGILAVSKTPVASPPNLVNS